MSIGIAKQKWTQCENGLNWLGLISKYIIYQNYANRTIHSQNRTFHRTEFCLCINEKKGKANSLGHA